MTGKAVGSLNDAYTHVRSRTRHNGRHTYTHYARAHYACTCAWYKCVNPGYVYNWFMLIERDRKELLGTVARNSATTTSRTKIKRRPFSELIPQDCNPPRCRAISRAYFTYICIADQSDASRFSRSSFCPKWIFYLIPFTLFHLKYIVIMCQLSFLSLEKFWWDKLVMNDPRVLKMRGFSRIRISITRDPGIIDRTFRECRTRNCELIKKEKERKVLKITREARNLRFE
jgi:hypothetical protein